MQVVRLLRASRLCFLSTFSDDHPHLSLMNFTYYPGEQSVAFDCKCRKYRCLLFVMDGSTERSYRGSHFSR